MCVGLGLCGSFCMSVCDSVCGSGCDSVCGSVCDSVCGSVSVGVCLWESVGQTECWGRFHKTKLSVNSTVLARNSCWERKTRKEVSIKVLRNSTMWTFTLKLAHGVCLIKCTCVWVCVGVCGCVWVWMCGCGCV